MNSWFAGAAHVTVTVIDVMALLVIVVGTVTAFASVVRLMFSHATGHDWRMVWLSYSRWLVAGLTFQLAADIVESATAESWDAVGRLAAVAVIRTFLNYFLERDLAEIRERDVRRSEGASVQASKTAQPRSS